MNKLRFALEPGRGTARISAAIPGLLAAAWLLPTTLPAQPPQIPEERVVVTANAQPVGFNAVARTVDTLSREEIARLPVNSVADLFEYVAGVDIRSRGPFGVQADISIGGATYQQALILVDGIRINDSQTGHHNTDLPLELRDIERVEILQGPGSALHGADAFGGIINIITRKGGRGVEAAAAVGQYDLLEASIRLGTERGTFAQSFTLFGNRSPGFTAGRDFRSAGFRARTVLGGRTGFTVAFVDKEFGAAGFYGPSPSREWTNQTMVTAEHELTRSGPWTASIQASYRTHGDRFLWDSRTPGLFENRHRTHAAAAAVRLNRKLSDSLSLGLGVDGGGDWILSSNLGDHSISRGSALAELQWNPRSGLFVYPGFRFDRYSRFGSSASPSLSAAWWVTQRVKLRWSAGRAFRVPTFTERYYRDPLHQASPDLRPERAWGFEAAADVYLPGSWLARLASFRRLESDVIDWVRRSATDKWATANIRDLTVDGGQLGLERSFSSGRHTLMLGYAYVNANPGPIDYISKYVLDFARHSLAFQGTSSLPLSLVYGQRVSYKRHPDGRAYWVLDGRLARRFSEFAVSLECSNMLGSRYQEVKGVEMPGRWLVLRLAWAPGP